MTTEAIYLLPDGAPAPPGPQQEGLYVYSPDHAERMVNRLIEIFRKPRNSAYLRYGPGAQIQEIEDVLWDIYQSFDLETAENTALDFLGAVVGELRRGRDDTAYRTAINVRLLVNRSNGSIEEMLAILVLADPSLVMSLREYWPASLVFRWQSAFTALSSADMYYLVRQAKPAGVMLHAIIRPASGGFRWSTTAVAGAAADDAFSSVAGGDGGTLQQVLG